MIPVRESTIEKTGTSIAKRLGWISYKFVSPSQRGVPDRVYIRDGIVLFVEYKRPGERPTPLQEKIHKDMRDNGAIVVVIDNVEACHAVFE